MEVKKEVFQFMRDVEDENIWMEEKMNLVSFRFRPFCEKKINKLIISQQFDKIFYSFLKNSTGHIRRIGLQSPGR